MLFVWLYFKWKNITLKRRLYCRTLSQLFDESTTHVIIEEAIDAAPKNGRIACITCPSIFCSLQESFPTRKADHLFDFDPRYTKYGNNVSILGLGEVAEIAPELQHAFAVVIADISMLVRCPCMYHNLIPIEIIGIYIYFLNYIMQGASDARSVMELVTLLSTTHEPLRLVLVATEELVRGLSILKHGLRVAQFQPRGRWGLSSKKIYTTIPHPRRLL